MKKLISLTDFSNFSQKFEIFKSSFLIEIKKCEFCESILIDFKNHEIDLKFYKEHKKYLYFIKISKNSLTIQKNIKNSEKKYSYLNEYEKTINL